MRSIENCARLPLRALRSICANKSASLYSIIHAASANCGNIFRHNAHALAVATISASSCQPQLLAAICCQSAAVGLLLDWRTFIESILVRWKHVYIYLYSCTRAPSRDERVACVCVCVCRPNEVLLHYTTTRGCAASTSARLVRVVLAMTS